MPRALKRNASAKRPCLARVTQKDLALEDLRRQSCSIDLQQLIVGRAIDETVVNLIMADINFRQWFEYKDDPDHDPEKEIPKSFCFSTHEVKLGRPLRESSLRGRHPTAQYGRDLKCRYWILPFRYENTHWYLVCYDTMRGRFYIADSKSGVPVMKPGLVHLETLVGYDRTSQRSQHEMPVRHKRFDFPLPSRATMLTVVCSSLNSQITSRPPPSSSGTGNSNKSTSQPHYNEFVTSCAALGTVRPLMHLVPVHKSPLFWPTPSPSLPKASLNV